MEKKVILSESLYSKLMYDMEIFGFDGSNNDFYSTVIINTFDFLDTHKKLESYTKLLSGKTNKLKDNDIIAAIKDCSDTFNYEKQLTDIAIEIERIHDSDVFESGSTKEIFVRETAKTKGQLSSIIEESLGNSAALVFKNIITKYVSFPSYIRERIIYPNIFQTLEESIRRKTKCKIITKTNNEFIIEAYKLVPGKDEYHYYITCYSTYKPNGERKPQAFKLSNINTISKIYESYCLTNDEIESLKDKISSIGPEYISGEVKEYKIELDQRGIKLYDLMYKDRPYCAKQDKGNEYQYNGRTEYTYIYTFVASSFQMEKYLVSFGYHAKVLNDEALKANLRLFYQKAIKAFE